MMKRRPTLFFLMVFGLPTLILALALRFGAEIDGLLAWILAISLTTFCLFAFDKWQARRNGWRVTELALHIFAFCGGTLAAFAAMALLRHKTAKPWFTILYMVFLVIQLAIAWRFLVIE